MKKIIFLIILTIPFFADISYAAKKEHRCIAEALYHEARSLSTKERWYIFNVIKNRVKNKEFPNTPCEVVYQVTFNPVKKKKVYQFSWTRFQKPVKEIKIFKKISSEVLLFETIKGPTYNWLFFSKRESKKCTNQKICHKFH